jgi:enoyl-CoA hydratase/carnithine racemase
MPPARLGLVYGHTGLRRFIDVVGVARTKELFLTGLTVEGPRAEVIGLVHAVTADDELPGTALELAETIAANGPLALEATKRILVEAPGWAED